MKTLKAAMLAGLLAFTGAAQAQSQFYLGAGVGPSSFDRGIAEGLIDSGSVDKSDTGLKFFGGFQVNRNFALEAAYVDLGEARYSGTFGPDPVTDGRVEVSGMNLSGVLSAPVSPQLTLFGKAGLFLWEAEARDITGGAPFFGSQDGTDLSFGIGASYAFAPNMGVRAEWEFFDSADADANLLSIGIEFRF